MKKDGESKLKNDDKQSEDDEKHNNNEPEKNGKHETISNQEYRGVCKWFNKSKGWGFINLTLGKDGDDRDDGLGGDIFVYQASIIKEGFRCLMPGDEVQCQVERRERGLEAVQVKVVSQGGGRRQKKVRCFNCGNITRHLAINCPKPPLPKRCHQCKVNPPKIFHFNLKYSYFSLRST